MKIKLVILIIVSTISCGQNNKKESGTQPSNKMEKKYIKIEYLCKVFLALTHFFWVNFLLFFCEFYSLYFSIAFLTLPCFSISFLASE